MDLSDREFWYRHCKTPMNTQNMGIVPLTWQTYKFVSCGGERISRSMLSIYELALLYSLARHFYKGRGMIIDAGPLLGASTFAFARGLADNSGIDDFQRRARIYSYDIFRSNGYERFLGDLSPTAVTGSLLPEFLAINRDYIDSIVVHQGDFLSWSWPKEPIEILFIDLAKTHALNAHAIKQFFPCLIPGQSVLVQQDYVHFNEYWIHITMEYFSRNFVSLGYIYGATAYYLCVEQINSAEAAVDLQSLPYERKMELLANARAKTPRSVQQVMKSAAAKCAIENGRFADAAALLDDVDLSVIGDDRTSDFRGIAKSNHEHVSALLGAAMAAKSETVKGHTMLTRDDVRGAYRYFLGREPESDEAVKGHLNHAADLRSLRARVLSAPEFYKTNTRELLRYFAVWEAQRKHCVVQYDCSRGDLDRLFAHIKAVWSRLGEVEPHFSVVSRRDYKPENLDSNMASFQRSGKGEVDLLQSELRGHGLKTTGYRHCVELGCGVGRVTRFLGGISNRTTGFDISAPHLTLAKDYVCREGIGNVSFEHITEPAAVAFPPCDLFYSRIVLQHNPPPIMLFLIREVLKSLDSGGVAVFQLPTYIEGYKFDVGDYLGDMDRLDNQELHALPQEAVFAALAAAGCDVLNVYRDNSLSSVTQVSNRFVVMKR